MDVAGAVQHVIVRGLAQQDIFADDHDRRELLRRLEVALDKTGCRCYAWSLIPNHFHLLIRTGKRSLSDLMRRVCTGYAVYFNQRHGRTGYLFQNRYKSIMCQEDSFFLELVRYIHLNPIRSGLVQDMNQLETYSWSGHAVLCGNRRTEWQSTEDVLGRFGGTRKCAVLEYRGFIRDGLNMGTRTDLIEGCLRRGEKGWMRLESLGNGPSNWRGDERVLGDEQFLSEVLKNSSEQLERRERLKKEGWGLAKLAKRVCDELSVDIRDLRKKGRANLISDAKSLICHIARSELGISGAEVADFLGVSRSAVYQASDRGERFLRNKNVNCLSYLRPL